jgi:hypothetical protein
LGGFLFIIFADDFIKKHCCIDIAETKKQILDDKAGKHWQ